MTRPLILHPLLADDPDDVRTHEPDEELAERPAGGHRGAQLLDGEVRPCTVDAEVDAGATVPASASPQLQDVEGEGQGTVRRPVSIPAPSAITPMATSGEVGRRESRSAADPCEGLGSVVAQDGDSSACRPNTRPRARLIATEGL